MFAGFLAFIALAVSIVLTLFVRLGHEVFVYVQRSFGFHLRLEVGAEAVVSSRTGRVQWRPTRNA